MKILKLLASKSFIIYSKPIAKLIGKDEAILWGQFCSLYDLFNEDEFYFEQDRMMEDTQFTLHTLRKTTKRLKELGLISIKKKGIPAKYYYKLNENAFFNLISSTTESDSTCDNKNDSTCATGNGSTNNKNRNKNKDENKNIHPLQKYISDNFSNISKLKEQLTVEQCEKLLNKYPNTIIKEVLESMENYKPLTKKYSSVNLTLQNWIKIHLEKTNGGNTINRGNNNPIKRNPKGDFSNTEIAEILADSYGKTESTGLVKQDGPPELF